MNAIIIYYSRSGNTEKIAKQLPSDLGHYNFRETAGGEIAVFPYD